MARPGDSSSEDRVDAQEPNPGRLAKRDEQWRQRRSVFMTALIGATVTAILAAAAAFRIGNHGAGGRVRIVTTTTLPPLTGTTDTTPDTTLSTLYEPRQIPSDKPKASTTSGPTTTAPATTTTSTTIARLPPPPPPPPTTPGQPAVARVVWQLAPGGVTVQSGAQFTITLAATNEGNASGSVTVPPCPAAPHTYKRVEARALSNTCHPGNQTLVIKPGQRYTWTDTISATDDATRFGAPLAVGNYLVLVNTSPSPAMFLRMKVTA